MILYLYTPINKGHDYFLDDIIQSELGYNLSLIKVNTFKGWKQSNIRDMIYKINPEDFNDWLERNDIIPNKI